MAMESCIARPVHNVIQNHPTNPRISLAARSQFKSVYVNPPFISKSIIPRLGLCNDVQILRKNFEVIRNGRARCVGGSTPLPEGATEEDAHYMRMCVEIARKALGCTSPNPMVGCVIVRDGRIVGQGFHPKAGQPHAEVFALREAGTMAEGATVYVSLEPCNHYGRTPPCTQALSQSKVKRVVVGMVDPNPVVASKGVTTLRNSGIDVIVGVEKHLCQALNEAYIHRMLTGKPFVTMGLSMSVDGGVLDYLGDGAAEEGGYYSELLQEYDGLIVSDYALKDNPMLLSCEVGAKQPLRIVVTRTFDLPIDSFVFDTNLAPTLVLADERAIVDDLQHAEKQGGQSMEMLLRQKGVDVVIQKTLDFDLILDVCSQRDLCSVLLDFRGSASFGLENFFDKQALDDKFVQKLTVAICPVLSGIKKDGSIFDIPPCNLNSLRTRMSKGVAVVEGYFPKDFR